MVSNYSAWGIPAIEVVEAFGGFGGLKILGLGISSGFGVFRLELVQASYRHFLVLSRCWGLRSGFKVSVDGFKLQGLESCEASKVLK